MLVLDIQNMTAYKIALWLKEVLDLKMPIDDKVGDGCYFEFSIDDGKGVVHCSNLLPSEIVELEVADSRASDSYKKILDIAKSVMPDNSDAKLEDSSLYVIFSCLHEFGHYEQWQSLSTSEFEELQEERNSKLSDLNKIAQKMADDGLGPEFVYPFFASKYRDLPLEKDADNFGCRYLKVLFELEGELF